MAACAADAERKSVEEIASASSKETGAGEADLDLPRLAETLSCFIINRELLTRN